MNINFKPANITSSFNKINKLGMMNFNSIKFKGNLEKDSFERNNQGLNPNTAFIYDPTISADTKVKMVKESESLYTGQDITKALGQTQDSWFKENCFEYEIIEKPRVGSDKKTKIKVFDMSLPINKANFETLLDSKNHTIKGRHYREEFGFDVETYQRYIKDGLIEETQLIDKNTKHLQNVPLIDMKNPINQEAPVRLKKLTSLQSDYKESLLYAKNSEPVMANVKDLANLGFGSVMELAKYIKDGTLIGTLEIKKTQEGKKYLIAYADINCENNRFVLNDLRNKRCVALKDLASRSGVDLKKIEDCVLNGEMETINKKTFLFDTDDLLIDTKNSKNIETFDKLLFEKRIEEEIIENDKVQKENERRKQDSLRMKIAWSLSVNTKNVARRLAYHNNELKTALEKKKELNDILSRKDLTDEERAFFENELQEIKKLSDMKSRIFYKKMWNEAGTEEFKQARLKANEIIKSFKENGIDSIEDTEIRNIIESMQN